MTTDQQIAQRLNLQQLSETERLGLVALATYHPSNKTADSFQVLEYDSRVKTQLPATIAIRTNSDEAKEFVQRANRAILPQNEKLELQSKKLNKKLFHIKVEKTVRKIECLCIGVKPETVKMLLSRDMLVSTGFNKDVIEAISVEPEKFDIHLIRRRSTDSRWYLMLQCEAKAV